MGAVEKQGSDVQVVLAPAGEDGPSVVRLLAVRGGAWCSTDGRRLPTVRMGWRHLRTHPGHVVAFARRVRVGRHYGGWAWGLTWRVRRPPEGPPPPEPRWSLPSVQRARRETQEEMRVLIERARAERAAGGS